MLRIRYPFAASFALLCLLSAYIGLLPRSNNATPGGNGKNKLPVSTIPSLQPNDKVLHLVTFFLLSLTFYWVLDTTRRRTLHLTIIVCTMCLGIGSELVQALLPNGRSFDPFDVLSNIVGSLCAVSLCTWYHKRMLERRRKARFGNVLNGVGEDVELGGVHSENGDHGGLGPQETGVTRGPLSLEQEVDNWDENAVDNWEEGADDMQTAKTGTEDDGQRTPPNSSGNDGVEDARKILPA
ncbi:VanZ domain-containing protein [Histoplasma capsulatum var. duboisii H88]|uniref:VanZ domain-containing protein n=1 Tax=Ajellomyces capsulatus (strain H88) TaxID=544711 RepID=F0U7I6_AJEC8|nr:VanZ domain-containing protein [Histoplasma capsulatum var. duboisii H88]QSS52799.1 VanZ domain-containing protein [Histoplasma capsulatum var. duboisii H88]